MYNIKWQYKSTKEESCYIGCIDDCISKIGHILIEKVDTDEPNLYEIIIYLSEENNEVNFKFLFNSENIEELKTHCGYIIDKFYSIFDFIWFPI
jgi:hypothetical protein